MFMPRCHTSNVNPHSRSRDVLALIHPGCWQRQPTNARPCPKLDMHFECSLLATVNLRAAITPGQSKAKAIFEATSNQLCLHLVASTEECSKLATASLFSPRAHFVVVMILERAAYPQP